MAVTARDVIGPYGPGAAAPVPVAATTVNSTNPNNFAVLVTPTNSVSNATITSVSVNGTQVQTAGGITVLVPANGTIKCTFGSGTLNYATAANSGATPVDTGRYPFTDPIFQNYTAQQNLTVAGVNASGTGA